MTEENEHLADGGDPADEERPDEGINVFWWIALFVSLGLWYGLFDAAMWAIKQITD